MFCRVVTQASRQAEPAQLTSKTFGAQDSGSEKLSLKVADPTASRGLVHRHVVLIQQNARQVRDAVLFLCSWKGAPLSIYACVFSRVESESIREHASWEC